MDIPSLLTGAATGAVGVGAAVAVVNPELVLPRPKYQGPRYPEHWPSENDWLDSNDPVRKYVTFPSPEAAASAGALPLGRTLTVGRIPIPDRYGFREWRRQYLEHRSKHLYIPEIRRFQHIAISGIVGGGKSTAFVYPFLAYDALAECSNVVIDVKSPEFFDVLYNPYRKNGKEVLLIDPWHQETLGFEPLYRSKPAEMDRLATIIMGYSPAKSQAGGGSKNEEFFEQQSEKLLRSLMELATHWPRRFANFPCIQQVIAAGGQTILESFKAARERMPTTDQVLAATQALASASLTDIEGSTDPMHRGAGRPTEVVDAIALIDRCGHDIQTKVRELLALWPETPATKRAPLLAQFEVLIERETRGRRERLEYYLNNIGDFLQSPDETRNSVIASVANKMKPFSKPEIARVFSRDELDLDLLVKRPTLLVIGTPLGEIQTGAGFVACIVSSLVFKLVETRQIRYNQGERDINTRLPVHLVLDELPQLGIKQLPNALSTLRSYRCGIIIVYQDRAQLEMAYGQDVKTIEQTCGTKIVLPGMFGETPKFIADNVLGMARVVRAKAKRQRGKDGSVVESPEQAETLPRMGADDVSQMRINGEVQPEAALQIGAPTPFPFAMTQYWNDTWIRTHVFDMERTDTKKPWRRRIPLISDARERWEPSQRKEPYLVRRTAHPDEIRDPFAATVEFLLKPQRLRAEATTGVGATERRRPDPLEAPILDLVAIGSKPIDLAALLEAQTQAAGTGTAQQANAASDLTVFSFGGAPGLTPVDNVPGQAGTNPESALGHAPHAQAGEPLAYNDPAFTPSLYPARGLPTAGYSGLGSFEIPLGQLTPKYNQDFSDLVNDDATPTESVLSAGKLPARTLHDYLRALDDMLFGGYAEHEDSNGLQNDPGAELSHDTDAQNDLSELAASPHGDY